MRNICKVENCGKFVHGIGYCNTHYRQIKSRGYISEDKIKNKGFICSVDGCENNSRVKGYCGKHYMQFLKKGHVYKTLHEPNIFIVEGGCCKIALTNKEVETIAYAVIDNDTNIINKCKKYKWHFSCGYAYSSRLGFLHHLILGKPPIGKETDHKDGNGLNCMKSNLRFCTSSQNGFNRKKQKNNSSGVKGVSYSKQKKKWRARINVNRKEIHLGFFDNLIDSCKIYDEACLKYHGEFARPNNILKT